MKRLVSSIISLVVLFSALSVFPSTISAVSADVWDGTADTSWHDDTKTTFEISTAEQLAGVSELCALGLTFEGVTFELTTDIALNTGESSTWATTPPANVWKPIGTSSTPFSGTFDGKGHTISGIYIYGPGNSSYTNVGLFGYVGAQTNAAVIKNLYITNSYMNVYARAGLLAGRIGELTSVENVHVNGTVIAIEAYPKTNGTYSGNSNTGGVIGLIDNAYEVYVSKCSFSGCVEGFCRTGAIIGGSVGIYISVENCFSGATVLGKNRIGGIVGHSAAALVEISTSVFTGEISHSSKFNKNYGAIMGGFRAGGTSELLIKDCYYDASFKTTDANTSVVSDLSPRVAVTEKGTMTSDSTWYTPQNDASREATGDDADGCEATVTVSGDAALSAFYSKADRDVWEIKNGQPCYKTKTDIGDLTVIGSGTFGNGLTWSLNVSGELTIGGAGEMPDFVLDNFGSLSGGASILPLNAPWYEYTSLIKTLKIGRGITRIGCYAFYECDSLENVEMYGMVKSIGDHAFAGCTSLDLITFYKSSRSFDNVVKGAYWNTNAGSSTTSGTYSVLELADTTSINYGDANGDGIIDNKDLVRIKKYIAGYDYDTGISSVEVTDGADVNGDGVIETKDLVRLKKYIAAYDYDTGTSDVVLGPI